MRISFRHLVPAAAITAVAAAAVILTSAPAAAQPDSLALPARLAQQAAPAQVAHLSQPGLGAVKQAATLRSAVAAAPLYRNPLRRIAGLQPERIDAGVDYGGSGPLYALGAGQIVMVYDGGWPYGVFICERLTQGRLAGRYVYYAEDIRPYVGVGQHVTTATRIGWMGYGGIETGWAAAPPLLSATMASVLHQWYFPTPEGKKFSWLLHHLGAPPGRG